MRNNSRFSLVVMPKETKATDSETFGPTDFTLSDDTPTAVPPVVVTFPATATASIKVIPHRLQCLRI